MKPVGPAQDLADAMERVRQALRSAPLVMPRDSTRRAGRELAVREFRSSRYRRHHANCSFDGVRQAGRGVTR
jgi:hypothetical protein